MKRIIVAVVLSLIGPGLGQIYNRQTKKGIFLLLLSALLLFSPAVWLILQVSPRLPTRVEHPMSHEMIQLEAEKFMKENSHLLNLLSFAFLAVWAYAITQSYFKAKELSEQENENL